MSYLQEARLSAARVEMVDRDVRALPAGITLPLLLFLAFFHGALYAVFLPPWGLIDESQHLHYIQYIAEEQRLPVAGNLYLSEEIVASLFATRRWETFHWPPPSAPDPQVMGLEGHSYEAYQPPLFYLLMTPLYLALPDDMLVRVYALRGVVVLLSLITVWATYRCAQILFPRRPHLAFWAALLLVAIPERAIATSRINNDVLLEGIAALFFVALTHALMARLTTRRSLLLGLLLGLGAWIKISAAVLAVPLLLFFWLRRNEQAIGKHLAVAALAAAPFAVALALRNLLLYGDLTGFGSFDQLHRLADTDRSLAGIVRTLISLPNHFWLVWWKGSEVGHNALLTLFYGVMALVLVFAWGRLYLDLRRNHAGNAAIPFRSQDESGGSAGAPTTASTDAGATGVAVVYATTVLFYALAVLSSYYEGMVPVIQGRFMLPAVVPFVLLLVWGLWRSAHGAWFLLGVTVLLWAMGLFSLFGNLLPYYYYWSGVVAGTLPPPETLAIGELLATVYQRALLDKPAFLIPLLPVFPVFYGLALIVTFFVALRAATRPPLMTHTSLTQ